MKNWLKTAATTLVIGLVALVTPASPALATAATQSATVGYSPYGSLATCFRTEHARVYAGKYYRDGRNDCGHPIKVWFQNMRTGATGPVYTFAGGATKRMHIALSTNLKDHYTLVVQTDPEATLSGGVWTPRYGSWYWPTKADGHFTACSRNPLKVKAVLNGMSAPYDHGGWRLRSYTSNYVQPGGYACVSWTQQRHSEKRVKVTWNNGKQSWTDGYEVVRRY